jgi:hypothetical protein
MTSRILAGAFGVCATLWLAGCSDDTTAPGAEMAADGPQVAAATAEVAALAAEVRQLAAGRGITGLQRPAPVRPALSLLGQALAFDKELSGNRDISCMTCHLATMATVDGHSTAIGQGAVGLGPARVHPQGKFVHRNAPPLSPAALEARAKEYTAAEGIILRLANRYDETVLRTLSKMPRLDSRATDDLDGLEKWTEQLSDSLPKIQDYRSSQAARDRARNGNGGSYTATLERGDADGEGVRIAIIRVQHGVGVTRYLPREFFETNEYSHIMGLAAKLGELLGEGAYVQRGDKRQAVSTFEEAIDWLMAEARRGQSVQRYKGLGEMNPDQLWDTTVNPETRRLMQVKIEDAVKADEIFTTLMGDQVEPRREFIERNALTVSNLDV